MTFINTLLWLSVFGSIMIVIALIVRAIYRNAPSWLNTMLWVLVALRLLLPVSIPLLSFGESTQTVSYQDNNQYTMETVDYNGPFSEAYSVIDKAVTEISTIHLTEYDGNVLALIIWVFGVCAMLAYAIISSLKIRKLTKDRVLVRDNVYSSQSITGPFIAGVIKPRIYLPADMSEEDVESVISHELAHISARDQWKKIAGFLVLTLHWFNPLVWVGYSCLCRDIEIYCDRRAVEGKSREQIADYSEVLLRFGSAPKCSFANPLSFAELGVKKRIKALLKFKKQISVVTYALAVLCIAVFLCSFCSGGKTVVSVTRTSAGAEPILSKVRPVSSEFVNLSGVKNVIFMPDDAAKRNGIESFSYLVGVFKDDEETADAETVTQKNAPALTVTGKNGSVKAAVMRDNIYESETETYVNVPSVKADALHPAFSFEFQEKPDWIGVSVNPSDYMSWVQTSGKGFMFDDCSSSCVLDEDSAVTGYIAEKGAFYYVISAKFGDNYYGYIFVGIR